MVRVTTHPALPEAAEPGYKMPEYKNQPCTPMYNSFPIQHEDVTQILLEMQKKSLSTAHIGAPTAFWGYAHPHASVHNLPLSFFLAFPPSVHQFCSLAPFPPNWGQQSSAALPCSFGSLRLQRVNWDRGGGGLKAN